MSAKSWKQELVDTLQALGGEADLSEIYQAVEGARSPLTVEWKATVRNTLESSSSDSDNYRSGREDLFYLAGAKGEGRWGLRNWKPIE